MHRQTCPEHDAQVAELARVMASSSSPLGALLDLVRTSVDGTPAIEVALLAFEADARSWSVLASTPGADGDDLTAVPVVMSAAVSVALDADADPAAPDWDAAQPIQGDQSTAVPLRAAGRLVGALVLIGCSVARWHTVSYTVATGLTMCLTGAVVRETVQSDTSFVERSARAIRRLFEEGAHARDVQEAGTVLARVAASAFETERAGMYVVDGDGLISFAVGVGVSTGLSDALASSLVGKIAAASPVWQRLAILGGPDLVDHADHTAIRPGGFVQTMDFTSYVAIPLLSTSGPLGMVICGDSSRQRRWTAKEHELATQFALEGALIVDAARLRASEQEQLARITHQANHDGLTGVPNRRLLMERLERTLADAAHQGTGAAMLLLDLDDFKQVNDTLGHRYGDELLREVARRLRTTVRAGDTLARLGGDEFAILLSDDAGRDQACAAACRIEGLLAEAVDLDGVSLNAEASVGIALFPEHAQTATDLLQCADIAMYAAKRSSSGVRVYHAELANSTVDKLTLHTELRQAITAGELRLVYQPKLDLRRNQICGVETLVRWQHPRRGLLMPGDFVPMAESTGLIHLLTAWVLEHSLRQWSEWHANGITLDVAVNVSVRDLLDRGLLIRMKDLIHKSAAADHLVLEVTETAMMLEPNESARALAAMRELGVRVSMDDFGAGYSSLAQLRQLPVDELKIDRMLAQDVANSKASRALVETIINLGHQLDLVVVAEGIETAPALQVLRELGCDLGQGYFISRPISADAVGELLQVHRLATVDVPPSPTGGLSTIAKIR